LGEGGVLNGFRGKPHINVFEVLKQIISYYNQVASTDPSQLRMEEEQLPVSDLVKGRG